MPIICMLVSPSFLSFLLSFSLWRPLYKWELPFLASLFSLETCQCQLHTLFKVQRLASHYTHLHTLPWPLLCLWGIFNFSVCAHIWICLHARVCVCHRWYGAGDSALIIAVTKASPPRHICHHPFPESVGGRGRMEGGHKEKEREEGKGRREKRRVDDGKWPPPRCHMGGGLKESVLCCSYWMPHERKPILPFVSYLCLVSLTLFRPLFLFLFHSLIFSHFIPHSHMKE